MIFLRSVKLLVLLTILCGIIYPFFMFIVGQLFFRHEANGSIYYVKEKPVGSEWIAQSFIQPNYFHPRPSAANFDATNSMGSNLGPTSKQLHDTLVTRAAAYRLENGLPSTEKIPAEAITASASGLDPHISIRNAHIQAARVAKTRNIPLVAVERMIGDYTNDSFWGLFGEPRINVLELNLALDNQK